MPGLGRNAVLKLVSPLATPAMFISSYLLSATIERNPEPSYAENDGAGVGGRSYE